MMVCGCGMGGAWGVGARGVGARVREAVESIRTILAMKGYRHYNISPLPPHSSV